MENMPIDGAGDPRVVTHGLESKGSRAMAADGDRRLESPLWRALAEQSLKETLNKPESRKMRGAPLSDVEGLRHASEGGVAHLISISLSVLRRRPVCISGR
jgi:hypothetical protein